MQYILLSLKPRPLDNDNNKNISGLCKDGHLTPGGGATEIELARQVAQWAETHPGLEQYSINKFAEALEIIPRVLAENSGVKPKEVISKLYAAHSEGNKNMGFDIDGESGEIKVSFVFEKINETLTLCDWVPHHLMDASVIAIRPIPFKPF